MTNPNSELLSRIESEPLRLVLAQLLEGQQQTQEKLNTLDSKIDNVSGDIQTIRERLIKIETRQEDWKPQSDNIGNVIEKVGELKNWRQIALIVIAALASGLLGWFFRGGRV